MNLLIVGKTGQIGGELVLAARKADHQDWFVHATDRATLDMSRPDSIGPVLRSIRPQVIINASGYTAVDRAEAEPELAHLINGEAVGVLAREAQSIGAALVHYSTDYVYDGRKTTPYLPTDPTDPQSVYGRSKLEGEQAIIASGVSHVILRTQWVYGLTGRNFVLAILRQGVIKPELRVVNDQVGAPTWARAIARATMQIVSEGVKAAGKSSDFGGREGVYHLSCAGETTWFDFAIAVFEEAARSFAERPIPRITPVSTAEYGAKAVRPAHAILDCSATKKAFGVRMPPWRDALREALSDRSILHSAIE